MASLYDKHGAVMSEDRCLIKCLRVEKGWLLCKWHGNFL